jgi:magnesium-transporting ATPase (P-type)
MRLGLSARRLSGIWGASMRAMYPLVDEVPFSSSRKMMATLVTVPQGQPPPAAETVRSELVDPFRPARRSFTGCAGRVQINGLPSTPAHLRLPQSTTHLACVKGAPLYVLKQCTSILTARGGKRARSANSRTHARTHASTRFRGSWGVHLCILTYCLPSRAAGRGHACPHCGHD